MGNETNPIECFVMRLDIVRGHSFLTAIQRASDLNINPGGRVRHRPLNWRHMKRIPADLRNRLE
jgi:hypothetical protein